MYIFNVTIARIFSEVEGKRLFIVTMETEEYGGRRQETVGFLKPTWRHVKAAMQYPENAAILPEYFDYFENMSDDEFMQKHYAAKLSDFSDEEIVAEFNKRIKDTLFHHIAFIGEAQVIKK